MPDKSKIVCLPPQERKNIHFPKLHRKNLSPEHYTPYSIASRTMQFSRWTFLVASAVVVTTVRSRSSVSTLNSSFVPKHALEQAATQSAKCRWIHVTWLNSPPLILDGLLTPPRDSTIGISESNEAPDYLRMHFVVLPFICQTFY